MTREQSALLRIADQLTIWADEAKQGGWSTQHVEPMRRLAAEIRESVVLDRAEIWNRLAVQYADEEPDSGG